MFPVGTSSLRLVRSFHLIRVISVSQTNILVGKDGALRIGGLGNVYILPHSAAWAVEDGVSTDRLFRSRAVAGLGLSPNVSDSVQPTKTGDVYSFGVLAFEVRKGRFDSIDLPLTRDRYSPDAPPSSICLRLRQCARC